MVLMGLSIGLPVARKRSHTQGQRLLRTRARPGPDPQCSDVRVFRDRVLLSGSLAIWSSDFGPVFGRGSAKLGPTTPLERRGYPRYV